MKIINEFKHRDNNNYGATVNYLVGVVGVLLISLGVIFQAFAETSEINSLITMLLYSIGASIFSSAIVTALNFRYMMETRELNDLLTEWRLHNVYETKSSMNEYDADEALRNSRKSIDIIAEGMSNYISSQGVHLIEALDRKVRIRIISCDSREMLVKRAQDESLYGQSDGESSVQHVIDMVAWVNQIKTDNPSRNIEVRFHSSYPGFSYLRLDSICFASANLWKKQSQQSFAISFKGNGKGNMYFDNYFEDLWNSSFVHKEFLLQ